MHRKLTYSVIVDAIWDCRQIPEYLEEMHVSELKQIDLVLQDWFFEIWNIRSNKFIESNYNLLVWEQSKTENLLNGFSLVEIELMRKQIKNIIDPNGLTEFYNTLKKLSDGFNYNYPTTKYTIIYHFLNAELNLMPISAKKYLQYVRENFNLKGKDFNRLNFDTSLDHRYENNLNELIRIHKK